MSSVPRGQTRNQMQEKAGDRSPASSVLLAETANQFLVARCRPHQTKRRSVALCRTESQGRIAPVGPGEPEESRVQVQLVVRLRSAKHVVGALRSVGKEEPSNIAAAVLRAIGAARR